jgi:hypothetical protein
MALPTATFDITKMLVGRQSIIDITIATVHTILLVEYVGHTPGLELGRAQAPGASAGPAYTARVWEKARAEMLKFRTKEIKKVNVLLGSLAGVKTGSCTAYIRDPADLATKVAEKTDDFACAIYRDSGEAAMSGDNPTELTLVLESLKDGAITFSDDWTIV